MTTASKTKLTPRVRQAPTPRPYSILDIEAEALEPAIKDVRAAIENDRRGTLKACYEIGLAIEEHYFRLHEEHGGTNWPERGDRYFEQLAEALEEPEWWLRNHFRLVQVYDEDEFDELCQTPRMTATKALQLAGLQPKLRTQLVQRIAEEGLTTRELETAIKEAIGVRRQPGAGRPPKRPKKLNDAFVHLTKQAEQFVRINDSVWFGEDYDMIHEIKELPMDKVNDDLKAKIVDAAAKCEALAAAAAKDAKALRGTLPEIDRRMAAQAVFEAQREADDERAAAA